MFFINSLYNNVDGNGETEVKRDFISNDTIS